MTEFIVLPRWEGVCLPEQACPERSRRVERQTRNITSLFDHRFAGSERHIDKKLKSLKVLLVEDEEKIAQLLKSALGDNFRSFLIAKDGEEGFDMSCYSFSF